MEKINQVKRLETMCHKENQFKTQPSTQSQAETLGFLNENWAFLLLFYIGHAAVTGEGG